MLPRAMKALLIFFVFSGAVFSACAQNAEPAPDTETLKTKIAEYMSSLFPNLQDVSVGEIEPDSSGPFLKAAVSFKNRGRPQNTEVHVTDDGKYLIIGQVWDLNVDPSRARWQQMAQGSEERAAGIDLTDRPSKGAADASVVVVEYSDYQCPYCSRAFNTLEGKLMEEYGDKIRLVFKHLPLEQLHPWAKKAAVAAACTYVQSPEAFWGMHSRLFENQKAITKENLREKIEEFGKELNLDGAALMTCFDEDGAVSVVEADLREAQQLGVTSTPTFMINGTPVAGAVPFAEMASYIDRALEDAAAKGSSDN